MKKTKRASQSNLTYPQQWLMDWAGGGSSASGMSVSASNVNTVAAVYACKRVISEAVGMLPWILYRRDGDARRRANDDPRYTLLHDEPNPEMSAMAFKETLQENALGYGNGYAEIVFDGERPVAMFPLPPQNVKPVRVGRALKYEVTNESGSTTTLDSRQVFHLHGLGGDGICGYSIIKIARDSLGLGMAAERFGAKFFGNGTHMGGALEHPGKLSPQAQTNLRNGINAMHQGADNAAKMLILEEGMKYNRFGIPPEDAQFLETRQFQVIEVCRWFGVPPHKVFDLSRATFSNIEHQSIEFVTNTIQPWLVRWEQEAQRKLLLPSERGILYSEHLLDALLRGDALSRAQALQIQQQNGVLMPDEWRRIENRNPLPDGLGKKPLVSQQAVLLDRVESGNGNDSSGADDNDSDDADPATEALRTHIAGVRRRLGDAAAKAESRRILKQFDESLQ